MTVRHSDTGARQRLVLLGVCLCGMSAAAGSARANDDAASGGFEDEIRAFEEADRQEAPPRGAVVCIGSSSMKGWHADIDEDLAPLTIVARGFGGSNMNDALHYADRIVIPYAPRAVVVYEGDNDVAQGVAPDTIAAAFRALVEKVRAALPAARFYVISIKPSTDRWALWPQMEAANRLLAEACAGDPGLTYIDVATAMLDAAGQPREEIFLADGLHMNRAGYEIWREAVRSVLVPAESQYESTMQSVTSE